MRNPPSVPLSAIAVAAYLAGLLVGIFGASSAVVTAAGGVVAVARHVRSIAVAGAALSIAAGSVTGRATILRRDRCHRLLGTRSAWRVELTDDAAPGGFARGVLVDDGCALPVRLMIARGSAAAGSLAHARGVPAASATSLTIMRTAIRELRAPRLLRRLRARATTTIERDFGGNAPLAKALLVADTRSLSPELRERFAAAGLVHMLSISGLHVGLIAVALSIAGQAVRVPRIAGQVATLVILAFYIAIIGAPAPAVRAGVMLAATICSRLAQRPVSPWAILALGAAGPLIDPATAADLGYQLSVVGIIALIAGDALVRRSIDESLAGWRRSLLAGAVASSVATVVTLPLIAWTFGRVSVVAPITNLAASPLMALAQPMLFLGLLLGGLPPVAQFVADAARPLLAAFDAVATVGASLPWATIDVAPTLVAAIVAAGAIAAFVVACLSRYPARAAAVCVALLALLVWLPALPTNVGQTELHVIDVGQGDAIALRSSRGRWILIDAGRAWRGGDAGRTTVVPYLRRRGGRLDAFILTHPHADHVGGAATVVRALRPRVVFDAAFAGGGDTYRAALSAVQQLRVPWRRVRPGDSLRVDDATLTFLAPDSSWTASLDDPNEASTVVLVRVGAVRFLLTGDAERREEEWLVQQQRDALRADVLKVGHHGSATSTTADFLGAVRPRLGVISVGAANLYGHPDRRTLQALAVTGAQVLRTDRVGSIVVLTDGSRLFVHAAGDRWELDPRSSRR